jgi:hypothetical protein
MDGGYRELATLESSLMTGIFDGPASEPAMEVDTHSMGEDELHPFEELPIPSTESPFRDDVPNGPSAEGTQSQPATNDSAAAPAMELADADRSHDSVTWRRAPVESSDLLARDALTVEEITRHARATAQRSPVHASKDSKHQSTPSSINSTACPEDGNEDAPSASSATTTPVLRIVGLSKNESTVDEACHSRVSE